MKKLILTHNIGCMANIALVDYYDTSVKVKRVPSDSPMLADLLRLGKIKECPSDLRDTGDVWLCYAYNRGCATVSVDGSVSYTLEKTSLDEDNAAFLPLLAAVPAWAEKSKVFVAKLLHTGYKVALRDYIKPAGTLTPESARVFTHAFESFPDIARVLASTESPEIPDSPDDVVRIEMWGHTLNRLYGSDMELLDPAYLSTLTWQYPMIQGDVLLWRGKAPSLFDEVLQVYIKGDSVLYVGYHTPKELRLSNTSLEGIVTREVQTYPDLLSATCVGLLNVVGNYTFRCTAKVCGEPFRDEVQALFTDFLRNSTVFLDVQRTEMPNSEPIITTWLYDVVHDKIYVFKSFENFQVGHYYGEMSVDEWLARR